MKMIVTGATGFIGGHVVSAALARGHEVTAMGRDRAKAESAAWAGRARFLQADLHAAGRDIAGQVASADVMLHLAWPGLSNFRSAEHVTTHFPADARFLSAALSAGLPRLLVTGTCLEYGLQNGALAETTPTDPVIAYGVAKDRLRRFLASKAADRLQWARLFYLYGPGQNPRSLLAQLEAAIEDGAEGFDMSGGEQLRDYLPVEMVADHLVRLSENSVAGVFNICSGEPISVRALVERWIAERGAKLRLNLGRYPYPDYEPMAFWGDRTRLMALYSEK